MAIVSASSLSAVLGLILLSTGLGAPLLRLSYDIPFLFRNDRPANDALIVYMDEPSRIALEQPAGDAAWNHALHAKFVDKLRKAGAKTIVFDIIFNGGGQVDGATESLASAIEEHGNVILSAELSTASGVFLSQTLMRPEPLLEEAAAGVGLVSFVKDFDQAWRKYSTRLIGEVAALDESLGYVAAKQHSGARLSEIPPQLGLNYYGPPYHLPNRSYESILSSPDVGPIVDGKLIFVGAKPAAGFLDDKKDTFATPYTRLEGTWSSGVELHATATLNMLHNDWLKPVDPLSEFWLTLGVGLLGGFIVSCLRPWWAVLFSLLAASLITGIFVHSAVANKLWFPFIIPIAVQLPAGLAVALVSHSIRVSKENLSLLENQAVLEAKTSSPPETSDSAKRVNIAPSAVSASGLNDEQATVVALVQPPKNSTSIPDYDLVRMIGRGAFGEVWLARTVMGTWRALKIIRAEDERGRRSLEKEYDGVRQYDPVSRDHSNLVDILHLGKDSSGRFFYYVMELADTANGDNSIDAGTYAPRSVQSDLEREIRFTPQEILEQAISLASALAHLHAHGLVHRDIKPANIIYVSGSPRLADVGLVTRASEANTFVGTYGYIPPEGPGSTQADVYSLGRVFEKMFRGTEGNTANTIEALPLGSKKLGLELLEVIENALAADLKERPADGLALLCMLEKLRP